MWDRTGVGRSARLAGTLTGAANPRESLKRSTVNNTEQIDSHTIQWVVSGSHTCDSSLCMAIVSDKHELYSATVG